ncbi:MAG TPA: glycyl-radical enzyme activating protein [Clostridiales bacterium]|nr:glycyl-radical enzyme activating protein [Clostridiales bacterium]
MEINITGLISDIQHFCVHDGPGIRTTIFIKGCNMRCAWCHNPETVYPHPEILLSPEKCIGCGYCDSGCFSGAKELCGREMTVEELICEVEVDRPYYGRKGGVTLSGGEPLTQPHFSYSFLKACRKLGIGTALETNLNVDWDIILRCAQLCDHVMCDLKIIDDELHKKYTGVSNNRILKNLEQLSHLGIPLQVRTPVISGINDNTKNIALTAAFLARLDNIASYELLTYHPMGLSKGKSMHFETTKFNKPSRQQMYNLAQTAYDTSLQVMVDNVTIMNLPPISSNVE